VMATSSSCDSGKTVTAPPGSASSVCSITKEYFCGTTVVTRSRAAFIVPKVDPFGPYFSRSAYLSITWAIRDLAHSVKMDRNYILSTPWCTRLVWCSAGPKSGYRLYRLIKRCHVMSCYVMLCYVTVGKCCLMFREDSIAEMSFCHSVQLMLICLKKKTNREEPYREYGDPRIRKRFLTRGNRQCSTVGTVPSPQLLLPCEVPHCTKRHGAPGS
jgi:hypothetical protein